MGESTPALNVLEAGVTPSPPSPLKGEGAVCCIDTPFPSPLEGEG